MNIAEQIKIVRNSGATKPEKFQAQIDRAMKATELLTPTVPTTRGVDRSGSLDPLPRPTIVRSV